jgi:hypothetical protein
LRLLLAPIPQLSFCCRMLTLQTQKWCECRLRLVPNSRTCALHTFNLHVVAWGSHVQLTRGCLGFILHVFDWGFF